MSYQVYSLDCGNGGENLINPIKFYSQKILPLVYDDSLSYIEVLAKFKRTVNSIIDFTEEIGNKVKENTEKILNHEKRITNIEESGGGGGGTDFDIHALTAENTIADADELPFYDYSVSAPRKTTWQNIKAKLKTYFDTLYLGASALVGYATQAWVEGKGYLTEHQSLAAYRTAAAQDVIDNGKQSKITASGLLKGDGDGGITAATVGTDDISALAVTNAKISNGAVSTGKITNRAVTTDKLAVGINVSTFTNDANYLTLETLPIYDGSVI